MPLLRAAFAVLCVLIGVIAVFIGGLLTFSALKYGVIQMNWGKGAAAAQKIVSRETDPTDFWMLVTGLGVLPMLIGAYGARWGWKAIS